MRSDYVARSKKGLNDWESRWCEKWIFYQSSVFKATVAEVAMAKSIQVREEKNESLVL